MTARVTVVGSINMDLVVSTERLPGPGETILGSDFQRFGGGKGANQALAAARMGARVTLIGKVGSDEPGEALVGGLQRAGVEVGWIGRADGPTGTAVITVDRQGTNTIVVVPAANHALTPDDVDAARGVIAASDAVLMQLEVPIETVVAAAATAKTAGVPVFLNPSPARSLPPEIFDGLAYLVVNETELAALTDGSGDPSRLFSQGVQRIVLTLGERGARLFDRERGLEVKPFRVDSIDTTAAGDAFLGALAATVTERGLDAALETASAAGALATTRMGAQPSLPTVQEVDAFMKTYWDEIQAGSSRRPS
jgi:ribokinase